MKFRTLLGSAAALAAGPALAADDTPTPSWTPDIIVTATRDSAYSIDAASVTRTDVPLIAVPQSIQVLTRTLLDEQLAITLADALTNVSGVVATRPYEAVLANPLVRGFSAEIFIDGLPAYGGTAVVDPSSLAGYEAIEVAKGPTSTLFGGGTGAPVGGIINLVTKTPQADAFYSASVRVGSFGTLSPSWDINQPLGKAVGLRLAGEYQSGGDYIDDVNAKRLSFNPSLSVALGEATQLIIVGNYSRVTQLEYAGIPAEVVGLPGVDPFQFSGTTDAPRTEITNAMVTGTLTHNFSDAIDATVQVRHYDSSFDENATFIYPPVWPPSGTVYPLLRASLPTDVGETTVDASLTATFATGALQHTLLAGFQWDATSYDAAMYFDFTPIGLKDWAGPTTGAFGTVPPFFLGQTDDYSTIAGYLQDQIQWGPVSLLASLRVTDLGYKSVEAAADAHYTRVSPRVGATWEFTKGIAAFAGWATGFRATVNFIGLEPPVPQTSSSVEFGLKAGGWNGVSGTLAFYRVTRQNVPTADPNNPFLQVQTGEQRSQGVDLDLIWEPSPAWSVLANYAFTDATVTKDNTIPVGDALARVPRNAGRAAVRYRFQNGPARGLGIGAGVTAASGAPLTLPNTVSSGSYATVDAQASYTTGAFRFGLSIVNLLNNGYFLPYQYFALPLEIAGQPRSAFLTMGVTL